MLELSAQQTGILERLARHGFVAVAFLIYPNAIGVQREHCAALLAPAGSDGLRIVGEPGYLVEGNLSVRISRRGTTWFVWKKSQVEATPERLAELDRFAAELKDLLLPTA